MFDCTNNTRSIGPKVGTSEHEPVAVIQNNIIVSDVASYVDEGAVGRVEIDSTKWLPMVDQSHVVSRA